MVYAIRHWNEVRVEEFKINDLFSPVLLLRMFKIPPLLPWASAYNRDHVEVVNFTQVVLGWPFGWSSPYDPG